jgi:hypothetical protein
MLIVSTFADVPIYAFPAETHSTPTREAVIQEAIITHLSNLSTK